MKISPNLGVCYESVHSVASRCQIRWQLSCSLAYCMQGALSKVTGELGAV